MKKLLVVLLCLSSTVLFAQTLHYTVDATDCEAYFTKVTGVLMIDGVEVYNGEGMQYEGGGNLEIGVFDQNGICRGAKKPTWRSKSNQWVYQLMMKGYVGCEYPTFKIYNHADGQEWDLVLDIDETIVWTANGNYGSLNDMYPINFTSPGGSDEETFEKFIFGYGDDPDNPDGHYYLISSPIGEVSPETVEGMIAEPADDYDLYYFDQQYELEWCNYKQEGSDHYHFDLMGGKGYLYASRQSTTLKFTGTPYSGDGIIPLDYIEEAEQFKGWNLVGNPFPTPAIIEAPYYRMNEDGTELMTGEGSVEAMEGIFVLAEEEGLAVTFTPNDNGDGKYNLRIDLTSTVKSSVIDRVIINFVEGQELPKFQINSNSTKVFVPKDNQDYAVVNAGQVGELPVCFKTQSNGRYTFNVSAENVSFSYLHLIDNMTGADVNLLNTPSYSFDALSTDYTSRFRLLFSTSCSVDGDNFSFVNGSGNLCIYGIEGEATLQVVDVLGHMLSSETFSGSIEKKLNVAPGVYMLRLIQGNDVKVQKTVIK